MTHDVFISYANEDQRVADAVCEALENGGVRCWIATRDVPYLVDYEEAIIDGISQSKLMLLILSEHANNSAHVKREVQNACREEPQVPVLPFQIADVPLSKSFRYYLGSVQWLVASTPPLEAHLQKLVNYVQQRLPPPEQDGDSGTQSDPPAQPEIVERDKEEAVRHAEEALRLAQDVERRRIEEEERLAAERETQRKAEEERQRREAEEKQRAEEEETQRRLAEEEAARLAAAEQQREEEERERKEAEERQRLEAEEAARRQAEEERVRAEAESRQRAEQEAERLRIEAQQEVERRRLEEEKQARVEAQALQLAEAARQAKERKRQRTAEQSQQTSPEEKQPAIPGITKPTSQGEGKSRRMMLIVILASVVLAVIIFIWMRQRSGGSETVNRNASLPSSQQRGPATNAPSTTPQPPPGMVYVPGGEFTMGRDEKDGGDEYERPAHKVSVKPFFIDIYEVTREEYKKCVDDSKCPTPQGWANGNYPQGTARQPVTGVDWPAASAYAKWAQKRLPTEEEWEFAARGTEGRLYPWGNEWRAGLANANGASTGMANVGAYAGASPFNVIDMSGNAWEWTASEVKVYPGGKVSNLPGGDDRIIRGGAYDRDAKLATTTYRGFWQARGAKDYAKTGFRCVKDVSGVVGTQ